MSKQQLENLRCSTNCERGGGTTPPALQLYSIGDGVTSLILPPPSPCTLFLPSRSSRAATSCWSGAGHRPFSATSASPQPVAEAAAAVAAAAAAVAEAGAAEA